MKNVVHIITGLNNGGAEMMLYKLLQNSDKQSYQFSVISMLDKGVMGERIEQLGVPVYCLNLHKKKIPSAIVLTIKLCKDADIIQTWMYHANLWGFISNIFLKKKIVWGIRRGTLNPSEDKASTIMIAKLCAKLSNHIDTIIYCAENSRRFHEKHYKYNSEKAIVIPNGFELERFKRDLAARSSYRDNYKISEETAVIAFIGRYHAVKGFENFFKALGLINGNDCDHWVVLIAGTGTTNDNPEFKQSLLENGLECSTICLGRRDDIPELLSAADILVSASYTEAFSNVIGEAMACEVPCVVTDVGDSAYIIGDTGIVVKNNDPAILADGIMKMLNISNNERIELGKKARLRIQELFEIKAVTKEYEKLYK